MPQRKYHLGAEVLGELPSARGLVLVNDEAHHAWRVPAESKVRGPAKADIEEATKWVGGAGCQARLSAR